MASEVAAHLQTIENIKALQMAQKEMADSIRSINEQIGKILSELRALKAETVHEATKETVSIVTTVQGGLNQRMEAIAVKLALMERNLAKPTFPGPLPPPAPED
jgi:hypothetical protein